MRDFILLMHADATQQPSPAAWPAYFAWLFSHDGFDGGSAIGAGETFRKDAPPGAVSSHLTGYIRIQAETLADAREFLSGNPVYECGGTVEIRELPRD